MNTPVKSWLVIFLFLTGGLHPHHGQNAPVLAITPPPEPRILVQGVQGADYQLQYASNLNALAWHSLTNFTMGASPFAVTDHAAVSNQMRFYRALLLSAATNVSYAPEMLSAGEILQFQFPSGFQNTLTKDHLAVNNSTNALRVRPAQQLGANPSVTIGYQRAGAFAAQLQIIEPPSFSLPMPRTNFYSLYFTSPDSGFYQATDGLTFSQTGLFTRDRSLVGQEIATATIAPGQIFKFGETNFDAASIVIDSPTNGVMVRNLGSSELLTSVGIRYEKLGPLAYQLDVSFPNGSQLITNKYWGIYQSPGAGIFNQFLNSAAGTFSRSDTFAGQQLAPLQLEAGEIYRLPNPFSNPPTDVTSQILLMNTASNGLFITPAPAPGISLVDIHYMIFGPAHCQLDVVVPATISNPTPQTNRYALVYTNNNTGLYQLVGSLSSSTGTFSRDTSRIGPAIASAALTAGEVYSLQSSNNSATGGAVVTPNSPSSGSVSWFPATSTMDAGIFPATLHYTRLGPLGARLAVVTSTAGANPQPITNVCYLAYLSTNGGFSQGLINQIYSPSGFGSFTRDQTLIGQQISQPQLSAGELYEITFSGPPPTASNVVTLLITSATNGLAFWEMPSIFFPASSGLTTVSFNYTPLGPRDFQLELVFPPSDAYPQPQTNLCTFVYSATNGGLLQVVNLPQLAGGIFRRHGSLVGQQPAPLQLTAGESYQIVTSNLSSTVTEMLLADSPTTGILLSQVAGPNTGIFPNTTLDYTRLNDFSSQITAVIPPMPPAFMDSRTNLYWLIYTATNSGLAKRSSEPIGTTMGRFQRQPSQ